MDNVTPKQKRGKQKKQKKKKKGKKKGNDESSLENDELQSDNLDTKESAQLTSKPIAVSLVALSITNASSNARIPFRAVGVSPGSTTVVDLTAASSTPHATSASAGSSESSKQTSLSSPSNLVRPNLINAIQRNSDRNDGDRVNVSPLLRPALITSKKASKSQNYPTDEHSYDSLDSDSHDADDGSNQDHVTGDNHTFSTSSKLTALTVLTPQNTGQDKDVHTGICYYIRFLS